MSKVVVTFQQVPKWPYAKTPEIKTAELQPGQRFYNQSDWLILSVEYQGDPSARQEPRQPSPDERNRVWVNWTLVSQADQLVEGHEYLVRTRDGQQRYAREHRMSYHGTDFIGTVWNARPFAGTQHIRPSSIIATMDLGKSAGRDDAKRYMNRIIK